MNNIEKLAIEHGAVHYSPPPMRAVKGLSFTFEQLEAFAKALQSSEPVAKPDAWLVPMILDFTGAKKVHFTRSEKGKNLTDDELKSELQGTVIWKAETVYINDSNEPITDKYGVRHYAKHLFTHPPASVPLEKYNKLLEQRNDAIKALGDLSFECFAGIGLTQPSLKTYNETFKTLDRLRKAIAEAEGKEG